MFFCTVWLASPGRRGYHPRSMKTPLYTLVCVAVALSAGCGDEIGDSCGTNVDCSPYGDRICDVSQTGGYCTIQGCTRESCPGEAVCVRFFPATFLSRACDPLTEDAVLTTDACPSGDVCLSSGACCKPSTTACTPGSVRDTPGGGCSGNGAVCLASGTCCQPTANPKTGGALSCDPLTEDLVPTDHCTSDEVCLTSGLCAQRTQERRFCMKKCDANSDCRSGYQCRSTGTRGAESVPYPGQTGTERLNFCAESL